MSHIPSSAMPHAGPTHHDTPPAPKQDGGAKGNGSGFPLAAIALGGVIALGAVAVAVPLVRSSAGGKPKKAKGKRKEKDKTQG